MSGSATDLKRKQLMNAPLHRQSMALNNCVQDMIRVPVTQGPALKRSDTPYPSTLLGESSNQPVTVSRIYHTIPYNYTCIKAIPYN